MNKIVFLILLAIGFGGLFYECFIRAEPEAAPATEEVKPEQILHQAFKNLADSKGYHIDGSFSLVLVSQRTDPATGGTGPQQIKKEGTIKFVHRNPAGDTAGLMHITTNWEEQEFESYQFIPLKAGQSSQLINRHPLTNEWLPVLDSHIPTITELYESIKDNLTGFQIKPPEKIRENNCLVSRASLNQEGQKNITNQSLPLPMEVNFRNILSNQFFFWINEAENRPARISFSMTISGDEFAELFPAGEEGLFDDDAEQQKTIALKMEMDFFDYDKNLDFILPDEVKQLLAENKSEPQNKKNTAD